MEIFKPETIAFLHAPLVMAGKRHICCRAYLGFLLDNTHLPPKASPEQLPEKAPGLLKEPDLWEVIGTHIQEAVFDEGFPKPGAEFLAYGKCHPQPGLPAFEVEVGVQGKHKLLESEEKDASLEAFGALPLSDPERSKHLGSFDKDWLHQAFPALPEGTKPEAYFAAPEDQRFETYFAGNEEIFIRNMHPRLPQLKSALPGLRLRASTEILRTAEPQFEETVLHADTLWLFPLVSVGVLRFAGLVPLPDIMPDAVSEQDALVSVLLATEPLDSKPMPYQHYFEQHKGAKQGEDLPDSEPAPAPETPAPPPQAAATAPEDELPDDVELSLKNLTSSLEAKLQDELKKAGLSRQDLEKKLDQLSAALDQSEPPDGSLAAEGLEELTAALEKKLAGHLADAGLTMAGLTAALDAFVQDNASRQDSWTENVDKLLADPNQSESQRKKLLAAKRVLSRLESQLDAIAEQSADKAPDAQPVVEDAGTESTKRDPLDFSNQDLTEHDFSGQELPGANFQGAVLVRTCFDGALLEKADFTDAILDGGSLQKARLGKACFDNAQAVEADFSGADFCSGSARKAQFSRSCWEKADLSGANLEYAVFDNARMRAMKATECNARDASFHEADLANAHFEKASLSGADFTMACLDKADFTEARMESVRLLQCRGHQALFCRADLTDSRGLAGTSFTKADFSEANLSRAGWGSVEAEEARFKGACLDGASFIRARLHKASFYEALARETRFDGADLQDTDCRRLDLFMGSLQSADLRGAKVSHSNLFGVQLLGVKIGDADFTGTNLKRTLLDPEVDHRL